MSIQTKEHSKFLLILYFLRESSKLKNLIKIAQTKARTITIHLSYRTHLLPIYRKLIIEGFEFSPSQQHFCVFGNTAVSQSN